MVSIMGFLMYIWVLLPFLMAGEEPHPCVLPFIYNRTYYSSCTGDGSENQKLWCATARNYDANSQWKYCTLTEYGGNSGGQPCTFPFAYKGQTYYSCTNDDEEAGKFWCATTGTYDKDEKWSYCADTRLHANKMGSCVFPFIYNGKCYSSCTTAGRSSGKLWCSLASNYDINPRWTYCDPSVTQSSPTLRDPMDQNSPGLPVVRRPLKFAQLHNTTRATSPSFSRGNPTSHAPKMGLVMDSCGVPPQQTMTQTLNGKHVLGKSMKGTPKGRPVSSPLPTETGHSTPAPMKILKTGDFGVPPLDKKWSYCADIRQHGNNMGPCVFPFVYKSKTYSSCTTAGASTGKLWCSLTSNYDTDPKWTYCDPSEPRPCHFPFIFKGKSYSTCTKEGAGDGQLWCATMADYDKESKWKACALQEYEGNSDGQACVFPFIYKSRTFYTCTNEATGDGRFWCATTENYDQDKKWSYCADTRLDSSPTGPCVFPFIFKGEIYLSCTADGVSSGKPGCSLTGNYDADLQWTYCETSGDQQQPSDDH